MTGPRSRLFAVACSFSAVLLAAACVIRVSPLGCETCGPDGKVKAEGDLNPFALVDSAAIPSDVLVTGARVFDERCAVCHGDRGHGDGTLAEVLPIQPRNYHTEPFKWGTRPSQIVASVVQGRSGIMPPFYDVLNERELWAVAYLVWQWVPPDRRERDTLETLSDWSLEKLAKQAGAQ